MKKILRKILVALIVASVGYGVYASQQDVEMSDLAMANVEALAEGEVVVGRPCVCVPNNVCIYFYPEYFEIPGATYE